MALKIRNNFATQLALKAASEGRSHIPITEVVAELKRRGTPVSRSTLESYKNGKITRYDERVLLVLCEYFGCELSDLLEIVDEGKALAPVRFHQKAQLPA